MMGSDEAGNWGEPEEVGAEVSRAKGERAWARLELGRAGDGCVCGVRDEE